MSLRGARQLTGDEAIFEKGKGFPSL